MSCPHSLNGSPLSCSQCIGCVPRRISYDYSAETLTVDGQPTNRAHDAQPIKRNRAQLKRHREKWGSRPAVTARPRTR